MDEWRIFRACNTVRDACRLTGIVETATAESRRSVLALHAPKTVQTETVRLRRTLVADLNAPD
jgi:hypothetical protein